ncbi:MAG: 50S ribosomal protein L11 methyltransferase [Bacteroidota bacterium]
MKEEYVEVALKTQETWLEPVVALLAEIGYTGFEERDSGLLAYVPATDFQPELLHTQLASFMAQGLQFTHKALAPQNWNALWESQYDSVEVDHFCQLVPSFHQPKPGFAYTIRLDPKMSFGTGHHETTRLMIRQMQFMDFQQKNVLDMGTGTGVLAILAYQQGAAHVQAIDIDPWSVENARENFLLNGISRASVDLGDSSLIGPGPFDMVLANINRNVLLQDIPRYVEKLIPGGSLLLSGILLEDRALIEEKASTVGLHLEKAIEEGNWASLHLIKKE